MGSNPAGRTNTGQTLVAPPRQEPHRQIDENTDIASFPREIEAFERDGKRGFEVESVADRGTDAPAG